MPDGRSPDAVSADEARYRRIFNKLDANSSGFICRSNLVHGLRRMRLPSSDQHVEELFSTMVLPEATGAPGEPPAPRPAVPLASTHGGVDFPTFRRFIVQREAQLHQFFHAMDFDRDGQLNKTEVQRGLEHYLSIRLSDAELREFIQRTGKAGKSSQTISRAEFVRAMLYVPSLEIQHLSAYLTAYAETSEISDIDLGWGGSRMDGMLPVPPDLGSIDEADGGVVGRGQQRQDLDDLISTAEEAEEVAAEALRRSHQRGVGFSPIITLRECFWCAAASWQC